MVWETYPWKQDLSRRKRIVQIQPVTVNANAFAKSIGIFKSVAAIRHLILAEV